MKRFLVDTLGNYVFFAPIVILLTPPLHSFSGAISYLLAAIPISLIGARLYTAFLKHFWYKLWKINF